MRYLDLDKTMKMAQEVVIYVPITKKVYCAEFQTMRENMILIIKGASNKEDARRKAWEALLKGGYLDKELFYKVVIKEVSNETNNKTEE